MQNRSLRALVIAIVGLAILGTTAHADNLSYEGWGVRVGLADDPDQVVVGAQFDLGEIVREVHFLPNFELGFGDDHTVLALTAPVLSRWEDLRDTEIVPYAGLGLTAALIDRDDRPGNSDDTDFEMALRLIGGAEWPLRRDRSFFIEIDLVFGDVHDIQALAGWNLRH